MRLIDADAVFPWYIEEFNKKMAPNRKIEPNEVRFSMYDIQYNLDNIPAIEERKTGQWEERQVSDDKCIEEWQSAICSVCGRYHTTPYMYYFDNYKYCPNCGARMNMHDSAKGAPTHGKFLKDGEEE